MDGKISKQQLGHTWGSRKIPIMWEVECEYTREALTWQNKLACLEVKRMGWPLKCLDGHILVERYLCQKPLFSCFHSKLKSFPCPCSHQSHQQREKNKKSTHFFPFFSPTKKRRHYYYSSSHPTYLWFFTRERESQYTIIPTKKKIKTWIVLGITWICACDPST